MKSKKARRECGRKYNKNYDPVNGHYYNIYWSEWNDHRDGFRHAGYDGKKLTPNNIKKNRWGISETNRNVKLKKLIDIRKAKRNIYINE